MTRLSNILLLSLLSFITTAFGALPMGGVSVYEASINQKINLTAEESTWITQHQAVNVAVKTGWMPIEYKIESEASRGISVDYLKQISELTGLKFNIIEYNEVFDPSKVQVVTGLVGKAELHNFTKIYPPHLHIPYAVYINKYAKSNYRSVTLEDLGTAKVAIYKNAPFGNALKKMYPRMQLVYVDVVDEAFEFLKNNEIDAYIGNELVIDYHAEFHRLAFAKKSSTTKYESLVSMAVRDDQVLLNSIISKALEKIGPNNPEILNYWKTPVTPLENFYKLLLALLLFAFVASSYKLLSMRRKSKQAALETQKMIWHQANYDRQTNLPNRNFFERKIKEVIQLAKQNRSNFAVLFIDLDDFKYVNDISGHSVGDQLLLEASTRLSQCLSKTDFIARIGGDEFVIILPKVKDIASVDALCQTILVALRQPFNINQHNHYISASIGVSLFPENTETYEELLSYADQAMYQAKKLGRDRYIYFTKDIQLKINEKISIANDLRQALTSNQLKLVYQPVLDLNTLKVVKAEALIRWHHPDKGTINPDQFIVIAEETGLIHPLGSWILNQAIKDLKGLHDHFGSEFKIAINISPIQFTQPQAFKDFILALDENNISPNVICFEITEGLLLAPSEIVINTIKMLKSKGVKFSIDDFGTGYSALAYLKNFDIDFLKIDKAFICNLDTDRYNSALCQFIILMAHNLGIEVVAEGVEYQTQENILRSLKCDYVQGYLHGKPMSKEDIIKL